MQEPTCQSACREGLWHDLVHDTMLPAALVRGYCWMAAAEARDLTVSGVMVSLAMLQGGALLQYACGDEVWAGLQNCCRDRCQTCLHIAASERRLAKHP